MSDNGVVVAFTLTIVAGVTLMIAAMNNRRRFREMEHRERLAMIERGVMPSPESDPAGFEAAAGLVPPPEPAGAQRYRTAGVLLVGVGVGLMFLIGVAADASEAGIGIGGAWVSLGLACLLNHWLLTRRALQERSGPWPAPPTRRPEPPPT